MAWVTWRQHRLQLYAMGALVALAGLSALLSSIPIRAAYHRHALSSCLPPAARSGCDLIVSHFNTQFAAPGAIARYLILIPALAGLFIGAPLLAREFEHGTYRLAWTQSMTRQRWLLSKTLLLCAATAVAAAALAAISMWWRQPFDSLEGRMSPPAFDIEGLVVPAYAVFALAVGILSGLLLRRTIPAMSIALGVFVPVRVGVEKLLRPHYLAPLHRTVTPGRSTPANEWVLQNNFVDALGQHIPTPREDLAILHAQQARIDPQEYLYSLGWRRVSTFQPDSRFWTFQLIEAGIFVALAVLAIAISVWLVRRRPA
jgi:ABC-type transport system involved in multi-copper enzyme maturation permease subunit